MKLMKLLKKYMHDEKISLHGREIFLRRRAERIWSKNPSLRKKLRSENLIFMQSGTY